MAIEAETDDFKRLYFTLEGRYSFEEFLGVVDRATAQPELERPSTGILDIRHSEETRTPNELRVLARRLAGTRLFSSFAVVSTQLYHQGLARMLSEFADAEGLSVGSFRTIEGAQAWLGDD